jgi:hypothetical protein
VIVPVRQHRPNWLSLLVSFQATFFDLLTQRAKWAQPAYIRVLGETGPCLSEVGQHYLHEDWKQDLVTFSDFARDHRC